MSEKLGGNHESNPEVSDANKVPESEQSRLLPPTVNTYGLKPEDVEQLERFFAAMAKDDLFIPAIRTGIKDMRQRVQLLQYPDLFSEIELERPKLSFFPNLLRGIGERIRVWFTITEICTQILGERSKTKPHYTFDLGRLVRNGVQVHILTTVLRQSNKQKILDVLPDESLTSYLYGNAGRRMMWGIPFDDTTPESFPTRATYDEIEEL